MLTKKTRWLGIVMTVATLMLSCKPVHKSNNSEVASFYDEVESRPGQGMTILRCAEAEYCVRNSQMRRFYWQDLAGLNCPGGTCVCDKLRADHADTEEYAGVFVDCPREEGEPDPDTGPGMMWFTKSRSQPYRAPTRSGGTVSTAFKFELPSNSGWGMGSPAVFPDGTVVVGADDGRVFCLKDGENRFEIDTGQKLMASPALLSDGTVVISNNGIVQWLKDGVKTFEAQAPGVIWSSPAVLADDTVVVSSFDNKVHWLKDGLALSVFEATDNSSMESSSPTVLSDGSVVIGSMDHKVYWLKDGIKKFEFETSGKINSTAAVMSDDTVVIGSYDGTVYWLKDGVKRFEFQTGGKVESSPTLLTDGTVVIGSHDDKVYWLKDGVKRFEFQANRLNKSSPVALIDGTVIIQTAGWYILWLKDGVQLFRAELGGGSNGSAPAVLSDGTVVGTSSRNAAFWFK